MKKILSTRSLLALFLVVSMLLTLLCACTKDDDEKSSDGDTEDCTEHIDSDSDGKCDNCDENIDPDGPGFLDATGDILANAVIDQLESAKSMKIDLVIDILMSNDYWDSYYDYETNGQIYTQYNDYVEGTIKLTTTVSKTENGVNVKVDAYSHGRSDAEEEFETEEFTLFYLVDGVIYTYDEYLDAYLKEDLASAIDFEELEAMLAEIAGQIEITDEQKNTLITSLGDLAITVFNIKDNKGSISIDAKPLIDDFMAYINAIDTVNDSVSDIIDDALALVDSDITTKAILDELERIAGLTVNQALAELDASLTENYDTTLQGLYDSIVNNPDFVKAWSDMLKDQAEPGFSQADIEATITAIQSIKIADLIAQYEIGDVVIYDLIAMFMADEEGGQIPTLSELFDGIEAIFSMPLEEFEEMTGFPIFTSIKGFIANITVNELNAKLDVNFKGIFNIDTIEGIFNYDVITKTPAHGTTDVSDIDLQVTLKIYDISKDEVAILAPTDEEIYTDAVDTY